MRSIDHPSQRMGAAISGSGSLANRARFGMFLAKSGRWTACVTNSKPIVTSAAGCCRSSEGGRSAAMRPICEPCALAGDDTLGWRFGLPDRADRAGSWL
jgi:hypothetical protein